MTDSEPTEPETELRRRALAHMEEALKIVDTLKLGLVGARLNLVIEEFKDTEGL